MLPYTHSSAPPTVPLPPGPAPSFALPLLFLPFLPFLPFLLLVARAAATLAYM